MTNYQFENASVSLTITVNGLDKLENCNAIDLLDDEIIEINAINPENKNKSFECMFVAKSRETGKIFELNIKSTDLPKINNIFSIDPTIILDIIKEEPDVMILNDFEDYVSVEYNCNVLGRPVPFRFQIFPHKGIIDLKSMNQCLNQGIKEMKRMNQEYKDKIMELENKIADLQDQVASLIIEGETAKEKTVVIVPFDKLVSTNEQAHDFLTNYYCRDEYKKLLATRGKDNLVEEFLNNSSKKLLFNMHYINRIEKRRFVSTFDHCENYGTDHDKTSAVNFSGLGFITTQTNQIFRYQKYDKTMVDLKFDGLFVFHWFQPVQHYELMAEFKNGMYLRIAQCSW